MGGPGQCIEIGVISLGTSSQVNGKQVTLLKHKDISFHNSANITLCTIALGALPGLLLDLGLLKII